MSLTECKNSFSNKCKTVFLMTRRGEKQEGEGVQVIIHSGI